MAYPVIAKQVSVISLEQQRTMLEKDIDIATDEFSNEPDWAKYMEIIDKLNRMTFLCPTAIAKIRKRLKTKNPEIEILALSLLEGIIKNCPTAHKNVADPDFVRYLIKVATDQRKGGLVTSTLDKFKKKKIINSKYIRAQCIDKSRLIILMLAQAYKDTNLYPIFWNTFNKLKKDGVKFPQPNKDEDLKIFTPLYSGVNAKYENGGSNDNDNNGSVNGKIGGAFGSIQQDIPANIKHLPMIKKPTRVVGVSDIQINDAQNAAIFLFELVNETPEGSDLFSNVIITEELTKLENTQNTIVSRASDPMSNEIIIMQAISVNDLIMGVINDVKDIMMGIKRRYRDEPEIDENKIDDNKIDDNNVEDITNEMVEGKDDNSGENDAIIDDIQDNNDDNVVPIAPPKKLGKQKTRKLSIRNGDNIINNNGNNNINNNNNNNGDLLDFINDYGNNNHNVTNGNDNGNDIAKPMNTKGGNNMDTFDTLDDPFSDMDSNPKPKPQNNGKTSILNAYQNNNNNDPFGDGQDNPFKSNGNIKPNTNNNVTNTNVTDNSNPFDFFDDLTSNNISNANNNNNNITTNNNDDDTNPFFDPLYEETTNNNTNNKQKQTNNDDFDTGSNPFDFLN